MNCSVQTDFCKLFGFEPAELPKIVALNPGKRKRFSVLENETIDKESISKFEQLTFRWTP
jgi:hypothetical protein